MGSKKFSRIAVPLSALALALPTAAAGQVSGGSVNDHTPVGLTNDSTQHFVRSYDQCGSGGQCWAPTHVAVPAATATVVKAPQPDGFAWGDAAIGAAVTLIVVLLTGLTTRRVQRRRISGPARPSTA
jgi:hypothetical protein